MEKEEKTGFYLVLIVAVVAVAGLLLLFFSSSQRTPSFSLSSSSAVTGSTVSSTALAEKMERVDSDEMEKADDDEFKTETLTVRSLVQGMYYSVKVDGGQIVVKSMKDPPDFSVAYNAVEQGIKDKNYFSTKSIKVSQLNTDSMYYAYYAGGNQFTMVET